MIATHTKLWYLENFNLFKALPEKEMEYLAHHTVMKTAHKDQYIYFPDEPSRSIFLLKAGKVLIGTRSDNHKEIIKTILGPGEIFGELALTGEEKRSDFAKAIEDNTLICAMNLEDMEAMMRRNGSLSLKIAKIIGFRLKKMERKLELLVFKDARTRIIEFLKDQAKEYGQPVGLEILIRNNLRHQDIANLTATSRQTVTTVLNELREKNLIYFDRKRILIRDINKLQ